jgi:hypothetical protein
MVTNQSLLVVFVILLAIVMKIVLECRNIILVKEIQPNIDTFKQKLLDWS